jgi:hypothetical protein
MDYLYLLVDKGKLINIDFNLLFVDNMVFVNQNLLQIYEIISQNHFGIKFVKYIIKERYEYK